jgi:PAS domain S-box-containing protein
MKEFESIEQFVREGRPHYDPMIDAVICTDLAWTVRYWNPAAERLYGWSAAQAEGRNMGELVPTSYGDVSRERLIERLMDEGEVEGEFVQVCRDGRRVVVWGRVISVRGRAGEPIGALGVNRDVSDLEEALAGLERLAREKEELLLCTRSVLEDGSFETTAHKVFDACCRLTGATSGYVALLDETGRYNDVLFLEPGGAECTVDPDLGECQDSCRLDGAHAAAASASSLALALESGLSMTTSTRDQSLTDLLQRSGLRRLACT